MPTTTAETFTIRREAVELPDGFEAIALGDLFIGNNGPFYLRHEATATGPLVQIGFRVERRHCNPMKNCHGGMLASFSDMVLPLSIHRKAAEVGHKFLPTINLQLDYLSPAPMGCWVQGEAEVLRVTRSLVFAQGLVTADGVPAVRISGIFKIGKPFVMPEDEAG